VALLNYYHRTRLDRGSILFRDTTGSRSKQLTNADMTRPGEALVRSRVLNSPQMCLDCEVMDGSLDIVEVSFKGKYTRIVASARSIAADRGLL